MLTVGPKDEVRMTYEYVINLRPKLTDTLEGVQEEVLTTQTKNALYYDKRARDWGISVDDEVLLVLPTNRTSFQFDGRDLIKFFANLVSTTAK